MLSLFLAYSFGVSQGKNESDKAWMLEECVNARFAAMDDLTSQVLTFIGWHVALEKDPPVTSHEKEETDKLLKGIRRHEFLRANLRDVCKAEVDAGVTDFTYEKQDVENRMKPWMIKRLEQEANKAVTDRIQSN